MNNSYSLKEGDKLTICYREREFYTSVIIIKFIFNQQQRSRAKGLRS